MCNDIKGKFGDRKLSIRLRKELIRYTEIVTIEQTIIDSLVPVASLLGNIHFIKNILEYRFKDEIYFGSNQSVVDRRSADLECIHSDGIQIEQDYKMRPEDEAEVSNERFNEKSW